MSGPTNCPDCGERYRFGYTHSCQGWFGSIHSLRTEALALLAANPDAIQLRSCWDCNPAHEHLRRVESSVISCFDCGRYLFKGEDVTDYEAPLS